MADTLQLEIVTPERLVEKDTVQEIQIPGKNGYLGILPGHAPLITELGVGQIIYKADGMEYHVAVAWGFAEVMPDKVTVLAETAERAEDIDTERARKAKERAEERLSSASGEVDYLRALVALDRANVRLEVAQQKK
jgi:F-type H+-transporting ATPase subunit epsilon